MKYIIKELSGYNDKNNNSDNNKEDYVEPKQFKDLIYKRNPLIKRSENYDCKELINFFIESMNNELTKRNNNILKKEIFNTINEEFKMIHNSIFSYLFYGYEKIIIKCPKCKKNKELYNSFTINIIPFEIIIEKKYNWITPRILVDYLSSPKNIQNSQYCKFCCFKSHNFLIEKKLIKAPNILIFVLDIKKETNYIGRLNFPISFDLNSYIKDNSSLPKIYNLIGIISWNKKNYFNDNLIAICKHFNDTWYIFNNLEIKKITENYIFDYMPYVLFYENKKIPL